MSSLSPALPTPSRLTALLERAWAWMGGVSVRTKIMGIVLSLIAVLGLAITWHVRTVMEQEFIRELENRGFSVASDLAARSADPILLNDSYGLYQLLTGTVANHPDLRYAFVVEPDGNVLVHTFGDDGFPTALLALDPIDPSSADAGEAIRHLRYQSREGVIHHFSAPVFTGRAGVVHLGLAETRLQNIVDAVTGQLLLTTVAVAVLGTLAAILLTWLLTRPILDLVATTRRVGQGDVGVRAPHWADDEIGDLADAFNQMVADLDASRQAIAEKDAARTRLLEQLITAQEEERKRIARELHDGVGQALTSLIVGLKLAGQSEDGGAAQARLEEMRGVAGETLSQVRLLSRQLRPSVLDDLGLAAALERYADEFSSLYPHISVDLHCDLAARLPALVETTLYRIIQEAMTNAARHGGASAVSVLVARREAGVQAIIEDDGHGFDAQQARRSGYSVGLHGMTERAELLGGRLDIESGGDGSTIYVDVPVASSQWSVASGQ